MNFRGSEGSPLAIDLTPGAPPVDRRLTSPALRLSGHQPELNSSTPGRHDRDCFRLHMPGSLPALLPDLPGLREPWWFLRIPGTGSRASVLALLGHDLPGGINSSAPGAGRGFRVNYEIAVPAFHFVPLLAVHVAALSVAAMMDAALARAVFAVLLLVTVPGALAFRVIPRSAHLRLPSAIPRYRRPCGRCRIQTRPSSQSR